ncbi:hypothetical protein MMC30_005247 [Trapelia coarctata]|nr:hypothetical protein [Trapelia coarctata]
MPADEITDNHGEEINEGDTVWTKIRGGKREGEVEEIAHNEAEAKGVDMEGGKGVKNPPKVIFHDQHGHKVAHNPGTLEKT